VEIPLTSFPPEQQTRPARLLGQMRFPSWLSIRRPAPEDAPVRAAAYTDTSAALPDWDAILDLLFWAGYNGTDAGPLLRTMEAAREREVRAARTEASRHRCELRTEFHALRRRREQGPVDEIALRADLRAVEEEARTAAAEVRQTRAALLHAHARLASERPGYAVRTVQERVRAEAQLVAEVSGAVAAADEARGEAERRIMNGELARRSAAQPELDAWTARQEQRHDELRTQASRQAQIIEEARSTGITQRVAGFLVWAGYLGMAAFGWRIGEVLHARANAAGAVGLVQFLSQESFETFLKIGPGQGLLWVAALAVLALVVAPAVIAVYDRVLTRFDNRWNPAAAGQESGRRVNTRRPLDGDAEARGVDLTWDSVVSTLHGKVERSDYRKHLARLPLIGIPVVLGLVVLVFLSVGRTSLQASAVPLNSLMFLFVGIAAAAMGTGVLCLLVSLRLRRREGSPRPAGLLWVLAAFGTAVLAWSVAEEFGWARTGPWDETALVGPAFLLLTNGVMLAHGLVYRNLYRDWTALRRSVTEGEERLRNLKRHSLFTIRDLAPTGLHDRWTELYRNLDDTWQAQDAEAPLPSNAEAPELGAAEDPADPLLTCTVVTRRDERMSPALAADVLGGRIAYHEAMHSEAAVTRRRHGLLSRLGELDGDALSRRMAEVRREAAAAEAHGAAAVARVDARYAGLKTEAVAAYDTGMLLREREREIRAYSILQTLQTDSRPDA